MLQNNEILKLIRVQIEKGMHRMKSWDADTGEYWDI